VMSQGKRRRKSRELQLYMCNCFSAFKKVYEYSEPEMDLQIVSSFIYL